MNQRRQVTAAELAKIRHLADDDLIDLISEIADNGWTMGRRSLAEFPEPHWQHAYAAGHRKIVDPPPAGDKPDA